MLSRAPLVHDEDAEACGDPLNVAGLAAPCALGVRLGVTNDTRFTGLGLTALHRRKSATLVISTFVRLGLPPAFVLVAFRFPVEMGQDLGHAHLVSRA